MPLVVDLVYSWQLCQKNRNPKEPTSLLTTSGQWLLSAPFMAKMNRCHWKCLDIFSWWKLPCQAYANKRMWNASSNILQTVNRLSNSKNMHVAISLVSALPYTVNISTELFTATLISNVLLLCFLLSHCTDCSRNIANVVSSLFLDCVYLQCSSQMFTEKNEVYWDFFYRENL